jgi:hypothetical protein
MAVNVISAQGISKTLGDKTLFQDLTLYNEPKNQDNFQRGFKVIS